MCDFGAALAGKGDDDASLEETMLGTDPGGNAPGAPAAIAGASKKEKIVHIPQSSAEAETYALRTRAARR